MKALLTIFLGLFATSVVWAQNTYSTPYTFTTMAGLAPNSGSNNGTGSTARFFNPTGTAVDANGNVYVADYYNTIVREVTAGGMVTTLAGVPGQYGNTNGTGSGALFVDPASTAVDTNGNVYVADQGNCDIRKIAPGAVVTTFAGTGNPGSKDTTGTPASFNNPQGVAVDSNGNVYVADTDNFTIRKITSSQIVTTLAGTAGSSGSKNGTGSAARFNSPGAVAADSNGNVKQRGQSLLLTQDSREDPHKKPNEGKKGTYKNGIKIRRFEDEGRSIFRGEE